MPKKASRRRRRSKLIVINIDMSVALGALLPQIVVRDAPTAGELASRSMYMISSDLYVAQNGMTEGEGPIEVGWAHDDLSITEIKEGIEADTADRNDQIALERAGRKIRRIGLFSGLAAGAVLNDGKDVRTRLGFMVDTGSGIALYAYSRDQAQLTTGGVVQVIGKIYARAG